MLRTYQGQSFEDLQFANLEKSFLASYEKAISRCRDRVFVKIYSADGNFTQKTFGEFDRDVQVTRSYLQKKYRGNPILATKSVNSYPHLVYICAILLGGFQFCPLNPHDPPERIRKKLEQLLEPAVILEDLRLPADSDEILPIPRARQSDRPFILVFTSGSTGHSKVVEQTEMGILTNVEALVRHHQLSADREPVTIATPLPLYHVNALEFSFFTCLLAGQSLVAYEGFDLFLSLRSLQEDRVQIFSAVPHILFQIAQNINKLKKLDLSQFRYFVTAAAPLPLATLEGFSQAGFKVLQGYGLSEAVNFSLITPLDFSPQKILQLAQRFQRPSAGAALWGNEVFVLDDELKGCSEGEVGDLFVRGPNVMLRYRNEDPAKVFVKELLNTGDRGFWHLDSETGRRVFFVIGRTKDIAKKMGTTVSLVEMDESLLQLLPAGCEGISVNFEDSSVGEELAIVLKNPPVDFDLQSFAAALQKNWGQEMLPGLILITDKSLRTESGKPLRWTFRERLRILKESHRHLKGVVVIDLRGDPSNS